MGLLLGKSVAIFAGNVRGDDSLGSFGNWLQIVAIRGVANANRGVMAIVSVSAVECCNEITVKNGLVASLLNIPSAVEVASKQAASQKNTLVMVDFQKSPFDRCGLLFASFS